MPQQTEIMDHRRDSNPPSTDAIPLCTVLDILHGRDIHAFLAGAFSLIAASLYLSWLGIFTGVGAVIAMPFCPRCGKQLSKHDRFCLECGSAIASSPSSEPQAQCVGPAEPRHRGVSLRRAHPLIKLWLLPLYIVELSLEKLGVKSESD